MFNQKQGFKDVTNVIKKFTGIEPMIPESLKKIVGGVLHERKKEVAVCCL